MLNYKDKTNNARYYPYVRHRHEIKQAIIGILSRIEHDIRHGIVPREREPEPKVERMLPMLFGEKSETTWVEPEGKIIYDYELTGILNN